MALKLIRKLDRETDGIRASFVETKQKKALVMMCSCVAEMKITEEGDDVYLYCEWMDQEPEEMYFEACRESIFDFLTFERDDIEALEEIREELLDECLDIDEAMDSRFRDEYDLLIEQVKLLLEEKEYDTEWIG